MLFKQISLLFLNCPQPSASSGGTASDWTSSHKQSATQGASLRTSPTGLFWTGWRHPPRYTWRSRRLLLAAIPSATGARQGPAQPTLRCTAARWALPSPPRAGGFPLDGQSPRECQVKRTYLCDCPPGRGEAERGQRCPRCPRCRLSPPDWGSSSRPGFGLPSQATSHKPGCPPQ